MILTLLLAATATLILLLPSAAAALVGVPRAGSGVSGDTPSDDEEQGLTSVAYGLCWGFGLVPYFAFCFSLLTGLTHTIWVLLGSSLITTAGFGAIWRRRGRPLPSRVSLRTAMPVLLGLLAIGTIYFVKYDSRLDYPGSCLNSVVLEMLDLPTYDDPFDVLTSNEQDQRLGNSAMMSGYVALYRSLGNRAAYAALGVFMALGAFLVGRRALGSRRWGWITAAVLTLNPYVFGLPVLDENLLFLGYSTLFLPLLLRSRVPWFTAGAMFGLALMMRHVALLCGLAMLWAVRRSSDRRWRALLIALVGFTAVTWIAHLHHYLSLGSVFRMENFGQVPPTAHRFIGTWSGLLQWPFHDHIVRTPWIPFPVFAMWPLNIADHLGLVLFSCLLLGIVALPKAKRDEGVFWLLWFVPTYLGLSAQEHWDHVNKMGIVLILFLPLSLWAATGLRAVVRAPIRWGLPWLIFAGSTWFAISALADYDAPIDDRYYRLDPTDRREDPVVIAAERIRHTTVAPWPDYGRMNRPIPFFRARKWAALARELSEPLPSPEGRRHDWLWADDGDRERLEPVNVTIDFSDRLFGNDDWLRLTTDRGTAIDEPERILYEGITRRDLDGDGEPDVVEIDLTAGGYPVRVSNLHVDWADEPGYVVVNPEPAGLMVEFEDWNAESIRLPSSAWLGVSLDTFQRDGDRFRKVDALGSRLLLRVWPAPFSVAEAVNTRAERFMMWHALVGEDGGIELAGPFEPLHN